MPKLTKKVVEGINPQDSDVVVWDAEIPGFGVRVWPSGRRVYILKYRNLQGRQRKPVIGRHGTPKPFGVAKIAIATGTTQRPIRLGVRGDRILLAQTPEMDKLASQPCFPEK